MTTWVGSILVLSMIAAANRPQATASVPERIVSAAERYLGKPYVFGGRDGRRGCRGVKHCAPGIDCQSLIFFAYEKVLGKRWTTFSVMPSISVQRQELGVAVPGVDGVLAEQLDPRLLRKGDVLFFLLRDYNLEADPAQVERDGQKFGVWHTGIVHAVSEGAVRVIHARPGAEVRVEPLSKIRFEALYALRLPP